MDSKKSILDFKEKEEVFAGEHDEMIAEIVSPYLEKITEENKRNYNEKFHKLSSSKRILVDSLIIKALFHNDPKSFESETIKARNIFENKSLKISLDVAKKVFNRELKNVFKKIEAGYIIPNSRIKEIKRDFFQNG